MDVLPPVANQPAPSGNGMAALSSILGVQQQRQDLATGQIRQNTAQADSQQAQQKNSELQAVGNLTKNAYASGRYKKDDGSFDNTKFANDVAQVAPTYGQGIANDATSRAGEIFKNQQTLFNLDSSKRTAVGNLFGSLSADPTTDHSKMVDAVEAMREQYPGDKSLSRLLTSMSSAIDPSAKGPALRQQLRNMAVQTNAPNAPESAPAMGTMQAPGGLQAINTNPQAPQGVGPVGAAMPQGVAPGMTQLPGGNIGVVGPGGTVRAATSVQQSGPPTDAPPINAPKAVQDAYVKATQDANGHVETVRTADENYGNNKAISSAIRHLASNATTGPGTGTWNQVMGFLGTPGSSNYQELGAFLDRQAATVRGQMGLPGTNAGAEDAKMIAGNTSYNAKVIQDKNDYTEALTEGLHQYRNGLDRIAGFSGQASPSSVNQFKSAWTQNFDPNVYKGELAYSRSKADGDEFIKSLSPREAAAIGAKRKALKALSQGQLP